MTNKNVWHFFFLEIEKKNSMTDCRDTLASLDCKKFESNRTPRNLYRKNYTFHPLSFTQLIPSECIEKIGLIFTGSHPILFVIDIRYL